MKLKDVMPSTKNLARLLLEERQGDETAQSVDAVEGVGDEKETE